MKETFDERAHQVLIDWFLGEGHPNTQANPWRPWSQHNYYISSESREAKYKLQKDGR